MRLLLCLVLPISLCACATVPTNPSFNVTVREAKAHLRAMEQTPATLDRPIVILSGFADPGLASSYLERKLRTATGDARIISIAFPLTFTFDGCKEQVLAAVEKAFPCDDELWTVEVDVVAYSMGGLIATSAAAEPSERTGKRLRIARLFTIATPHRGADMARLPTLDPRQIDMRAGSAFMQHIAEAQRHADYTLIPYTRLGDTIVGDGNTAPHGATPWWIHTPFPQRAHMDAYRDSRIIADIARRLRNESALTLEPRTAVPEK